MKWYLQMEVVRVPRAGGGHRSLKSTGRESHERTDGPESLILFSAHVSRMGCPFHSHLPKAAKSFSLVSPGLTQFQHLLPHLYSRSASASQLFPVPRRKSIPQFFHLCNGWVWICLLLRSLTTVGPDQGRAPPLLILLFPQTCCIFTPNLIHSWFTLLATKSLGQEALGSLCLAIGGESSFKGFW